MSSFLLRGVVRIGQLCVGRRATSSRNSLQIAPTIRRRPFSSTPPPAEETPKDREKVRRAYALGGCLMVMWISTHAILLYKRRSEFRSLNENVPPIEWDTFVETYLDKQLVKTIIFQPHFEVANVYLHSPKEQLMKKKMVDFVSPPYSLYYFFTQFHTAPDKFTRPPDVRVLIEGTVKEVKAKVQVAMERAPNKTEGSHVDFEIDEFPSYRELSFVVASSVFAIAAISLMK